MVTGEVPLASVLRSHQPLVPPSQFNPDLSPHIEAAILQGMAEKLTDRPQSIATWQSLLKPSRRRRSATRTAATQVVAPRVPTQVANRPARRTAGAYPNVATSAQTVAVNGPSSPDELTYGYEPGYPATPAPRRRRQANPVKTLSSILGLTLLAAAGIGGYRLYQQISQAIADFEPPTVAVNLPQVELPNVAGWGEAVKDVLQTDEPPAEPSESVEEVPPPAEAPTEPIFNQLPMLLANLRSQPISSEGGGVVSIPGFAPGTQINQVLNRLGPPTRQSAQDNFSTAVYDLIPNRASVAYVYDQANNTVQQAEAAFAPTFDRLVMRIALTGMLGGQSTKDIESGLEAVRTEQRQQYTFEQGNLEGVIERTPNGFIHIHVRPKG